MRGDKQKRVRELADGKRSSAEIAAISRIDEKYVQKIMTAENLPRRPRGGGGHNEERRHGHAGVRRHSPTYVVWNSMTQRCGNPKAIAYQDYGARGITVCERWLTFVNFLADMGERPSAGMSIDRIDNSRGYEPGNCRWATRQEQNRNQRRRRGVKSPYRGVYPNGRAWRAQIKIEAHAVHLGTFASPEDAARAYNAAARQAWGETAPLNPV